MKDNSQLLGCAIFFFSVDMVMEIEVQTSSYKISHRDVMYSSGNIVSNIVITLYGDRWLTMAIIL